MIKHIESGRTLNGWTLRKTLELNADFDSAVDFLVKVTLFACWILNFSPISQSTE